MLRFKAFVSYYEYCEYSRKLFIKTKQKLNKKNTNIKTITGFKPTFNKKVFKLFKYF